jgi:hypothetical protein
MSLLGIAAEVVTGNTLTMQFRRVRYTPVYYLNGFEKRLADLRRFRAMARLYARDTGGRGRRIKGQGITCPTALKDCACGG